MHPVEATAPYPWPHDGVVDPARLALVIAGAQPAWIDRCADPARLDGVREVVDGLAGAFRAAGAAVVVIRHLAPAARRHCPLPPPAGSASSRLSVAPAAGDVVVEAWGVDGFHGSPLDDVLRSRGIDHLALAGFGHEATVDSTLRSANDRGYECLVVADALACFDPELSRHALSSVTMSGGIFGAVGASTHLLAALRRASEPMEAVS